MARVFLICERAECRKQFSINQDYAEKTTYCCSGCRKCRRCNNKCDIRHRRDSKFEKPPPASPPPKRPRQEQPRIDARIPPQFLLSSNTYEVQVLTCLMKHYVPPELATVEQNRTKEHVMKAMLFMHHPDKSSMPDAKNAFQLLTNIRDWYLES